MGQRVIPCAITAEYVAGDGVTLGAAGSHNSVLIEYDFRSAGPQWDDISGRYVLWTNPQGNSTNRINLGVSEKVEGYEGVYQAAPPADAMCVPGWAEMVVVGYTLNGETEVTKIKTEPSRFRVLPGSSRAADNEGVAPTVVDQLQAEIEAVDDRKVNKPRDTYGKNGVSGQVLSTLGNGETRWVDPSAPTPEQIEAVLSEHPEWVTTVQDNSLTKKQIHKESVRLVSVDCHNRAACNAVIFENGDFFLIDLGDEESMELVIDSVINNGGTRLCGCIISHVHHDHIAQENSVGHAGYKDIIEAFPRSEYFPIFIHKRGAISTAWPDGAIMYDDFCAYASQVGTLITPDADTAYQICGADIRFANTDVYLYQELYNDFCLCAFISLGWFTLGAFGDIHQTAQSMIVANDAISKCDVILCPHHGTGTQVNARFIRQLKPKMILCNTGSASEATGTLGYNSAVMAYCNETQTPILNTGTGDIVLKIGYDGEISTKTDPEYYPVMVSDYSSLRGATNIGDGVEDLSSEASLRKVLLNMPKNARITCLAETGSHLAQDLMLSGTRSFIEITKRTGASTSNLYDRGNPDNFYFTVRATIARVGTSEQCWYGRYQDGTFEILGYLNTPNPALLSVGSDGTITIVKKGGYIREATYQSGDNAGEPIPGTIETTRGGIFVGHFYNSTDTDTTVDFGDVTVTVPAYSSNAIRITRSTTTLTLTASPKEVAAEITWYATDAGAIDDLATKLNTDA